MKTMVWVIGNSSAGKESFIRAIVGLKSTSIREQLGWARLTVEACETSLNAIGQYDNDPIALVRNQIFNEVTRILKAADVVLIKWQAVDSEAERIQQLRLMFPEHRHEIIHIKTDCGELAARLPNKKWWRGDDLEAFIEEESERVKQWISRLGGELSITQISGNSGDNYSIITPCSSSEKIRINVGVGGIRPWGFSPLG